MVAPTAQSAAHPAIQARQPASRCVRSNTGNVSAHASSPCGRVKVLAKASTAQLANFTGTETGSRTMTTPLTMKSAGRNEKNPEASSQTSYCAGEKMQSTANQKQIATCQRETPLRQSTKKIPPHVSQAMTHESMICWRTSHMPLMADAIKISFGN